MVRMSSLVSALKAYQRDGFPGLVLAMAGSFWLVGMLMQIWRLESLTATYDQALFFTGALVYRKGTFF